MLDLVAVDRAIDSMAEDAFSFLSRLVAAPSTLGDEAVALDVFAAELASLGFTTSRVVVPPDIASDPDAGVSQGIRGERFNVLGTLGPKTGRSLLLNGHIDVVPADSPHRWSSPPFEPRRDGRYLFGRGAGDMKCGFALGVLALRALLEVHPDFLTGPLLFLAVIEEECTGNGTLAAVRQGVVADGVVLLEPTNLDVMVGGVGVFWCDITIAGRSAHAESAHNAVNPVLLANRLVDGLTQWSQQLRQDYPDEALSPDASPYNLNVGQLCAGDWPSSVPAEATVRLRIGFPRSWSVLEAEKEFRAAVADVVSNDPVFTEQPVVSMSGFRAPGYLLPHDHPLTLAMVRAHRQTHAVEPRVFSMGSTTDARTYLHTVGVPALCYGPSVSNIHGVDESVDLDSIVAGARTLVRFLVDWYAPRNAVAPRDEVSV